MRDVAVAVGERDDRRREREHDQRELPGEMKRSTPTPRTVNDVLEEEDQPVAEEEADRLQVDGRARHQLPGLVAVEVAEREPDELRVERVAEVELDPERLLAGDQPPAERADAFDDADHEHDPDQPLHLAVVVVLDRRHDLAGQPREGERARLRDEGEDDRESERQLVGPEEAEEAPEGRAVARRVPVRHRPSVRTASHVTALQLPGCGRSSRCRTSPRAGTPRRSTAIGAALAARPVSSTSTPIPTTTARCSPSSGTRASSSTRSSPASIAARERIDLRRHDGAHPRIGRRRRRPDRADRRRETSTARAAPRLPSARGSARSACRSSSTPRRTAGRPSTGVVARRSCSAGSTRAS